MFDQLSDPIVSGNYFALKNPVHGAGQLLCGDLFAGAGGLSLAAMNVGMNVRFAVEYNNHACDTYRTNLVRGGWPVLYEKDINKLTPQKVSSDSKCPPKQCDLILGGPPCQGFSVHRINDAGVDDPRNKLILSYFRYVKFFRPKVFLMENVPGLLWPRHADYLRKFYNHAKSAGYSVYDPVTLEAADFGAPQRRKRVFVLGVRNGINLDIQWPVAASYETKQWKTAKAVFRRLPKGDENAVHMNHGPELVQVFKSTPKNGGSRKDSSRVLSCHNGHNGHKDVYGRIDPCRPGPTMTTACINPSKGRFVHPTEHHGIAVRHAARFQTFPDEFTFRGGLTAAGEQIGNAVPVVLGEAVIGEIARALLRRRRENSRL